MNESTILRRGIVEGKKAENFSTIEDIFAHCVDIIQFGEGDIDSCLAQFPDRAAELRPLLEIVLWLDKRKGWFDPRPVFVPACRKRLDARIKAWIPETLEHKPNLN